MVPITWWPGIGVNTFSPEAFLKNQVVYGGFTSNLNVLSVYATNLTFIGTSPLICDVLLLNYSQNFIIFIPRGPNAWPIFGFGLATPAKAIKLIVAKYSYLYPYKPYCI